MTSLTWVSALLQGWHPLLWSQCRARCVAALCPTVRPSKPQHGGPDPVPRMVWWTCYPRSAQAAPIRSPLLREPV